MTRLTDEQLIAIGSVAQEWARLEGTFHILISSMLGGPLERSSLVGPSMGSKLSMEFAAGLATTYRFVNDSHGAKTVAKFVDRAGKLATRRNDVVHVMWKPGSKPDELVPLGLKVRAQIKFSAGTSSAADFLQLAQEIAALAHELVQFLQGNQLFPESPDAEPARH